MYKLPKSKDKKKWEEQRAKHGFSDCDAQSVYKMKRKNKNRKNVFVDGVNVTKIVNDLYKNHAWLMKELSK